MKAALLWAVGLTASLGAHAALFAFLALATEPDPLIAEPAQSGKIKMTSYEVPQSKAAPQDAKGDEQAADAAEGQALGQGPVRSETAEAQPLPQSVQPAEAPTSERPSAITPDNTAVAEIRNETVVEASSASGAPTPALRAEGAQAKAAPLSAETLASATPPPVTAAAALATMPAQSALSPTATPLNAAQAPATQTQATPLPTTLLASASADAPAIGPTAPNAGAVPASSLITETSSQISADGATAAAKAPPAQPAPSRAPDAPVAVQPPLNAPTISAATGWSGDTTFDPTSLAAIQSFMQPLDASQRADTPRDAISQLLASVPCARLAATFIPETGTLELRGHIPDDSLRAPILTAIRQQLGESIPVGGSMIVLPSPQCDVLSRLENLGLPQSTKQALDPKELGAVTQLTSFEYGEGERVIIRMKSYDFPAYVYVDFFDVDGNVLHLRPNQWEPLQYYEPGANITVGDDGSGQPAIQLIVRPPFGRELAVAYASSEPIYEGLRDTIEPAEPYLAYLRGRIAELKSEHADYKGDWVYMFVETHE
ncbi:MAG: DUF4384 domain-containing protein [Rhodobacteraceae bacterium]|nr:DUF4384 domain-containing protein [Paracoccaceae bacterium]